MGIWKMYSPHFLKCSTHRFFVYLGCSYEYSFTIFSIKKNLFRGAVGRNKQRKPVQKHTLSCSSISTSPEKYMNTNEMSYSGIRSMFSMLRMEEFSCWRSAYADNPLVGCSVVSFLYFIVTNIYFSFNG